MTSASEDLQHNMLEELIQFYYYELKDILARLEYDMEKLPTLHKFQLQIQRKYFWGETEILISI